MEMQALLDRVRTVAQLKHLSPRTEQTYAQAIRRFVRFHAMRPPSTMGVAEVRA